MNRYFALVIALAFPLSADAFQSFTRHIDGATITARRSATQPCGVDLDIKLTNSDQRMVIIDYTYSGTFDYMTFSGVYKGGLSPPRLSTESKSGVINASMGPMTYLGLSHLTFADPKGLYCLRDWTFNFIATSYNATQAQRDAQSKKQQQAQAKIDADNKRKADQAENKRKSEQLPQYSKNLQEHARIKIALDYRSNPANAHCRISYEDEKSLNKSISECEKSKNRLSPEEKQKQAVADFEARRKREEEARIAAEDAARAREYEEAGKRLSANPCAVTEGELRFRPPQPTHTNPRQQAAMVAQQTAQRAQMLSQYMKVCVDRDPCAAADILARLEPAKLRSTMTANYPIPASATPQQRDAFEKRNAVLERHREESIAYTTKMIAMLESSPPAALDRARSACTASRNRASAAPAPATQSQYPTPSAAPYSTQPPATPAAQATEPCFHLRMALENDKNNLLLAYQLRRCIKKANRAAQNQ